MSQNINIGALAAEEDNHFQKHFIHTSFFEKIAGSRSDIVFGAKGVGKTALMRALTELNSEHYYNAISIDLSSISFRAIHSKLESLQDTTNTEIPNLARTIWKNILISYGLLAFCEKQKLNNDLRISILDVLKEDKFIPEGFIPDSHETNFQVMNSIENIFRLIGSLGVETETLSLTPEQHRVVNKFPLNDDLNDLLQRSIEIILRADKKILVSLDGFDSIVDHSPTSRKAIFAGLIDAVLKLSSDRQISRAFCFKAFLPQELTVDATTITWELDKYINRLHYLRWMDDDFKSLIVKRLSNYSKKRITKFTELWAEFFPEKVPNSIHSAEENSFEYILRHTLYRPRQILTHIQNILTGWYFYKSSSTKVDPSFIPQIVATTNMEMASRVAAQLSIIYPNITKFLKSWNGSSCVIEAHSFRERIRKYFPDLNHSEVDALFDELFNFGVIGIHSKQNIAAANAKKLNFSFAFIGDNLSTYVHTYVADDDVVAFSPMFREYCGSIPCADGFVNPISLNVF